MLMLKIDITKFCIKQVLDTSDQLLDDVDHAKSKFSIKLLQLCELIADVLVDIKRDELHLHREAVLAQISLVQLSVQQMIDLKYMLTPKFRKRS